MSKLIERDGKYMIEVGPNDSFGSIAYEHTGDSSRWLELLKCNDVDATRPIVSGLLLRMPETWAEERARGEWSGAPEAVAPGVAAGEQRYPNPEPAAWDGSKVEDVVRDVLKEWAERVDPILEGLKDRIGILEMQRDQDEKRLAEQGAEIIRLRADVDRFHRGEGATETPKAEPHAKKRSAG